MKENMNIKTPVAGLLLSMFAGFAHAEGNYSGMRFGFVFFAIGAFGIMGMQIIYTLCMSGTSFGTRMSRAIGLIALDILVIALIAVASNSSLHSAFPYILSVIPGFIAIYYFRQGRRETANSFEPSTGEQ